MSHTVSVMYLGKTEEVRATATGQFSADPKLEATRNAAAAAIERTVTGCRIGVVISDDCSSREVANILASTCERFGEQQRQANTAGKMSITIIAGRSGFVLRDNACLPVWCEAIYDVDPLDFDYFVVPKSGGAGAEPRPDIVSWLARAGAPAKIISLSAGADIVADVLEPATPVPAETGAPDRSDGGQLDRHKTWQAEINGAGQVRAPDAPGAAHAQAGNSLDMPAPSERIKATVEWISENYGARISISSMAERALMSERNFLRRFRAEMGHTPHEYLSKIRLESARKLLMTTALPVDKIARHCGLFNGDHLRKHFVKQFGMSPVEYRTARFKALQSQDGTDAGES